MVRQREIVLINFRLPGGIFKEHPVIVLSNDNINSYEEAFVAVMISGTEVNDEYSFPLTNDMLTKDAAKKCQVRCHLISLAINADVKKQISFIKPDAFEKLIDKINNSVFHDE